MSQCPNCGSKFESGKFRCPNCGSLLVYGGSEKKGPSFWNRIMRYKNIIILLAIAVVIASAKTFLAALDLVYWVLIIGLVAALAILWLRGRNRNAYGPPQNRYHNDPSGPVGGRKKHANVIPFKKKRDAKIKKAKRD